MDKNSNIFGATPFGGETGCGTVFELVPGGQAQTIYSFACGTDGREPMAGLFQGANGDLYGTTEFGGKLGKKGDRGTVFSIQQ